MNTITIAQTDYKYRVTPLSGGGVEVEVWARSPGGKSWHKHRIDVVARNKHSDANLVAQVLANGAQDITDDVPVWTAPATGVIEIRSSDGKREDVLVVSAGDKAVLVNSGSMTAAKWRLGANSPFSIDGKQVWFRQ